MANAKECESVVTACTRVLRPRTPRSDAKVDTRGMSKAPAVSKNVKTEDFVKGGDVARKRKVQDKGAASGSTRILRSNSAKKGDEAEKEVAKAKTDQNASQFTSPESTGKRLTRSATKGQLVVHPNGKGKTIAKTK